MQNLPSCQATQKNFSHSNSRSACDGNGSYGNRSSASVRSTNDESARRVRLMNGLNARRERRGSGRLMRRRRRWRTRRCAWAR